MDKDDLSITWCRVVLSWLPAHVLSPQNHLYAHYWNETDKYVWSITDDSDGKFILQVMSDPMVNMFINNNVMVLFPTTPTVARK